MRAEHAHQKAQKFQRTSIGLDHHGLRQSLPPPTDMFLATGLYQQSAINTLLAPKPTLKPSPNPNP